MANKVTGKKNDNFFTAKLSLEGIDQNIAEEIYQKIEKHPFGDISQPLYSYKYLYDDSISKESQATYVVGHIIKYNKETNVFSVCIYENNKEVIKTFKNPIIEPKFIIRTNRETGDDELNIITKLILTPEYVED